MTGSKWTGFFAFVLGAGLGVMAGMLLAAKSGDELREDLTGRLDEGAHRLHTASKSVARRAQDVAKQVQQKVSGAAEAGVRASRKVTHS